LARSLGIPDHKLTVIENGIDVRSDEALDLARALARSSLGITDAEITVGFMGRLVPQKAPLLAVETFRRLHLAYPSLRFVLAGDGPDAPAVSAALDKAGLSAHVRWLRGAIGRDVLPAVDILLVTSGYEGFSYVMLEALDAACAIVTTSVGGASDCVVSGRNGEIVSAATPEALAGAARAFIERPESLRAARIVSRVQARHFEIGRMVDRLVTLYRSDCRYAA
jgi:glycosyltransferase involved in cell wall biosynthesis